MAVKRDREKSARQGKKRVLHVSVRRTTPASGYVATVVDMVTGDQLHKTLEHTTKGIAVSAAEVWVRRNFNVIDHGEVS